jgi:aminopeptidase N
MPRRTLALIALASAALLAAAAPAAATRYVEGSPGLGDPYYPLAGNGGYDVRHYHLDLDYTPPPVNFLEGRALVVARATQNLSRFNLDFRPFYEISSLTVNGRRASYTREGDHELVITPRPKLKKGRPFVVRVTYSGQPQAVVDPDESLEGWVPLDDDGAFVVNEPQGSPGWYPANDNPRDKATYSFEVTVPEGQTALANGRLVHRPITRGGRTTWRWIEDSPMAPYLATATNGVFDTDFSGRVDGTPIYNAVDPDVTTPQVAWDRIGTTGDVITFFSELYGEYPFSSVGNVVDLAPEVGYALESQTKAMYSNTPSQGTFVHEMAHQWFGNAVTPVEWVDIWLNEGFARWSQWIWDERDDNPATLTAQQQFDNNYAQPASNTAFWNPPPGNPGSAAAIFEGTVYTRGAMTLQALRQKIGDDAFFRILRTWYAENKYGNATTADFIAVSERVSGQQLDQFFEIWLYDEGKPAPGSW